jgi:hypothetical protein
MAVTPVALRASTFVETIGVNVHMSWKDTVYGNVDAVANAISTLGIKHLRDGARSQASRSPISKGWQPLGRSSHVSPT